MWTPSLAAVAALALNGTAVLAAAPTAAPLVSPNAGKCIAWTYVNPKRVFGFSAYDLAFTNSCASAVEFFVCIVPATGHATPQQLCSAMTYRIVRVDAHKSVTLDPQAWPIVLDLNVCPEGYRAVPTAARQQRFCGK